MLNRIIVMGRMTRDPELRRTGSGTAVTSFSLLTGISSPSPARRKRISSMWWHGATPPNL